MNVRTTRDEKRLTDAMGRYADGEPVAFEVVYEMLAPVVLRCMRRWVGNPTLAQDLTQETFLRVHRARERYRRGAAVGPWVLTIARRLSIDSLRRRAAAKVRLTFEGDLPEPKIEGIPDDGDDRYPQWLIEELRSAIAALPESQRSVVAMHKLDGMPLSEVAKVLGIKEGAARVRAHRGYKKLRSLLAGVFSREEE